MYGIHVSVCGTHVCGALRLMLGIFLYSFPTYFLREGLLLTVAWAHWPVSSKIYLSHIPRAGVTDLQCHCRLLCCIWNQILMPTLQAFSLLTHPSLKSPIHCFWKVLLPWAVCVLLSYCSLCSPPLPSLLLPSHPLPLLFSLSLVSLWGEQKSAIWW